MCKVEWDHKSLIGHASIGHIRWSTFLPANDMNARSLYLEHITVIHAGVIESYAELQAERIAHNAGTCKPFLVNLD